jgi:hypothetical protein
MYMPDVRRIQADAALGTIPRWFVAGLVAHTVLALVLTLQWSLTGTAVAVLIAAFAFEAHPVVRTARRQPSQGARSNGLSMAQLGSAVIGAGGVLLLAWWRLESEVWAVLSSGALAVVLGAISLSQFVGYMKSSRGIVVDA